MLRPIRGAIAPETISRVNSPEVCTIRPSGATMAEIPVLAARTRYAWFSTARKAAIARCWTGAALWPNQASLVMFTSTSAPARKNSRTSAGKIAS